MDVVDDFLSNVFSDVRLAWREVIYISLVALGLSLVVCVLFRFLAGFVVYLILGIVTLLCIAATAFLW